MATSGSSDFNLTSTQFIEIAMNRLSVLAEGQSATTAQLTLAKLEFNLLIKELQNRGAKLWTRDWEEVTLTASSVVTGSDTNVYECIRSHTSDTTTKPVTGVNWTSFWEKTSKTTGGAWADATSYNYIGDFTINTKYIDVTQAFVRYNSSGTNVDTDLTIKTIAEYFALSDKLTSGGTPTTLHFDRTLNLMTGFLYPTPDENIVLNFLGTRKLEDIDADVDNVDFPSEWF